jgi:hypothetical protein
VSWPVGDTSVLTIMTSLFLLSNTGCTHTDHDPGEEDDLAINLRSNGGPSLKSTATVDKMACERAFLITSSP